jgi:hypothetical protein
MCNTIGCPNFDSPPLCAECTWELAELKAENVRLRDALSIALQYVPLAGKDTDKIYELIREAD